MRMNESNCAFRPLPNRATSRTAHAAYWRDEEVAKTVMETLRGNHE